MVPDGSVSDLVIPIPRNIIMMNTPYRRRMEHALLTDLWKYEEEQKQTFARIPGNIVLRDGRILFGHHGYCS